MSKDTMKEQSAQEPQTIDVQEQPTGTIYYFPNEGGTTSFSVKADSREEAEERNSQHLEDLKKEDN